MGIASSTAEVPTNELISASDIERRVADLAARISQDYRGQTLCVVGVLTGAVVFLSDLIRHLELPVEVDFVAASSYGEATRSSGEVRILKDVGHAIQGKHVLIVEDIIDTGLTLRYLVDTFRARLPASVECCVLLDKPSRRIVDVTVAYRGFEIEDRFVVGYGLDYKGLYRNVPFICELDV